MAIKVTVAHLREARREGFFVVDEPLRVCVTGQRLREGTVVTLVTEVSIDSSEEPFVSTVSFACTTPASLDLSITLPLGLPDVAEPRPMLIFDLIQVRKEALGKGVIFYHRNMSAPLKCTINAICEGEETSISFNRWYFDPERTSRYLFKSEHFVGALFVPKTNGKVGPVIFDFFGSGGGLSEHRAALLASNGYTAMAVAYFRLEHLPKSYPEISIDGLFVSLFDFVTTDPLSVLGGTQYSRCQRGVVLIGLSTGGDIVLTAATLFPQWIRGVVLINGTSDVFMDWKVEGLGPLQRGPMDPALFATRQIGSTDAIGFAPCYAANANPRYEGLASFPSIPCERIPAPILAIAATNDDNRPSHMLSQQIFNRLKHFGLESNFESLVLKGAGHLIEPPYSAYNPFSFNPSVRAVLTMGGSLLVHCEMQQVAWIGLLSFLARRCFPAAPAAYL